MWLNIHTFDSKKQPIQYMISCFPDAYQVISKDTPPIPIIYNVYSNSKSNNLLQQTLLPSTSKATLNILKTTTINNSTFPTIVRVNVADFDGVTHIYTIDTTAYGDCVTIDMTGNLHWSGSALLYDSDNNKLNGSAFLEANQFEDPKTYRKTIFEQGNMDMDTEDVYSGGAITLLQAVPSIFLLSVPIIMVIAIVVFIIKGRH